MKTMNSFVEERLYQAVSLANQDDVIQCLATGASPNKVSKCGKTCLGLAASIGNTNILSLLLENINASVAQKHKDMQHRHCQKKWKLDQLRPKRSSTAPKNTTFKVTVDHTCLEPLPYETNTKEYIITIPQNPSDTNMTISTSSSSSLSSTSSPQTELEWDEELSNVAAATAEDESCTSLYKFVPQKVSFKWFIRFITNWKQYVPSVIHKWYASILERTGEALEAMDYIPLGVDKQDSYLKTALHYAAEEGHVEVCKMLLTAGALPDIATNDGLTPLHLAVIKKQGKIIKILIKAGSNVNYVTYKKRTALHLAASRGHLKIVELLIKEGASIEARDITDASALHLAAGGGHAHVLRALIAAGANINEAEVHGNTALSESVRNGHAECVAILLDAGARITHSHKLLHHAISEKRIDIAEMLINTRGINLEYTDESGNTPLLVACRTLQPEIIKMLIRKGCFVNGFNTLNGTTVLHALVDTVPSPKEFESLLLLMQERWLDLDNTSLMGDTALNRALLLRRDATAKVLIKHGACVNAGVIYHTNRHNLTMAVMRDSIELVELLMKAGYARERTPPLAYSVLSERDKTLKCLERLSRNPFNLTDYCRLKIRSLLRFPVLSRSIDRLPLPIQLKKFLMFDI